MLTGKTMGTYWQIKMPFLKQKNIKNIIQNNLNKDENMLSLWKKNSIVSQFNNNKKNILQPINKKICQTIYNLLKINKKTEGKLDITAGSLINLWGFGNKKKLHHYPTNKEIKKEISLTGSKYLQLIYNVKGCYLQKKINGIKINLSTIGEGFAVDHLSSVLHQYGIENYIISVGGTILVKVHPRQSKSKIIAIQTPTDIKQSVHLLVSLKNNAISTAGNYRNYYYLNNIRISHLIDPINGKPIKHNLVSVSVIASSALEADTWDTGLLILGFKKAKKLAIQEKLAVCLIMKRKNHFYTWISPAFKKFIVQY